MSQTSSKGMGATGDFRGTVDGIDIHAFSGQPVRCFAFVNQDGHDTIQVITDDTRLQSALELASSKKCEVEVSFEEDGTHKILRRVRLLDR